MVKPYIYFALSILLGMVLRGRAASPSGSFIQLNRMNAVKTEDDWCVQMEKMRDIGIHSLIVQWSAEPGIAYVQSEQLPYPEQFDTLDRILSAAQREGMYVHLGLVHDPDYWTAITARTTVLRDYFLVRIAENEALQNVLLKRFAKQAAWAGYYIPDEIDDLSWRSPERADLFNRYLTRMCARLNANDPQRPVSISAFFRSRTAPDVFRNALIRIVSDSGLNRLLLQDGTGTGDPHEEYLPLYYRVLTEVWPCTTTDLACIIEVFEQTSSHTEPFAAKTASPERVNKQMDYAAQFFEDLVLFTFPDYVDPDLGPDATALFTSFTKP